MLSVLLIWIYMLFTILPVGYAVLKLLYKVFKYNDSDGRVKIISIQAAILAGLCMITVYAEFYSIFDGVGGKANVLLVLLTFVSIVYSGKELFGQVKSLIGYLNLLTFFKSSILIIAILSAIYFTSSGYFIFDTGLYHAQAIRWIETYGTVVGSSHINSRLGFNSASMVFQALYSFRWLTGQSYHVCNGFVFIVVLCNALSHIFRRFEKKNIMSLFVNLSTLFCCCVLQYDLISPSSDTITALVVLWIFSLWVDLEENEEANVCPYALLSIACVFAVTLKVSVALCVLLVIKPAVRLIKDKQLKSIIIYVVLGGIVLMPYLIRNVMITGWLVYPLSLIDLFDFDWKVPKEVVQLEANYIIWFGRKSYYPTSSILSWLTEWWANSDRQERIWMAILPVSCIVWVGALIHNRVSKGDYVRKWMLVEGILFAGLVYWFFSAPSFRFGLAFILLFVFLVASILFEQILSSYASEKKIRIFELFIFVMMMGIAVWGIMPNPGAFSYTENYRTQNIKVVSQQDYWDTSVEEYRIGEEVLYYPLDGEQVWYNAFPGFVSLESLEDIELRGSTLAEGFRIKE